jgi:hypothetical protein
MGLAERLPTLAELQRERRAVPKYDIPTSLDTKTASDKDDAKLLEQFKKAVAFRDRGRCRVCGRKTIATVELVANRREIHHLRPRSCKVTRYDRRNGVVVCHVHHTQLTRHQLFVVQIAALMFQVGRGITAKSYLNSDAPLTFTEKRPT